MAAAGEIQSGQFPHAAQNCPNHPIIIISSLGTFLINPKIHLKYTLKYTSNIPYLLSLIYSSFNPHSCTPGAREFKKPEAQDAFWFAQTLFIIHIIHQLGTGAPCLHRRIAETGEVGGNGPRHPHSAFLLTSLILLHVIDACLRPRENPTVLRAISSQGGGWGWVGVPVAPRSHPVVSASSMLGLVRTADQNQGAGRNKKSIGIQTPPAPDRQGQSTSFGSTQSASSCV